LNFNVLIIPVRAMRAYISVLGLYSFDWKTPWEWQLGAEICRRL